MDFQFSDEQLSIQAAVREFAQKKVAPFIEEIERSDQIPGEIFKQMGELDFFKLMAPIEFGGIGRDRLDFLLTAAELSRISPALRPASRRGKWVCGALQSAN